MTASQFVRVLTACLVLGGCGGGERPEGGASGSATGERAGAQPSTADRQALASGGRAALRDPVQLSATADIGGTSYRFAGLGECQHTADASIYEVPASMWSARFTDEAGKLSHLNLTIWQPKGAPSLQVSLGLTAGGETSELATVQGAELRGAGTGRVEPKGNGGALIVEGRDAAGRAVKLTVDCSRFTEPVAEGG